MSRSPQSRRDSPSLQVVADSHSTILRIRTRPSAFIRSSYPSVKSANPDLPILIREARGTPARGFVRFGQSPSSFLPDPSSAFPPPTPLSPVRTGSPYRPPSLQTGSRWPWWASRQGIERSKKCRLGGQSCQLPARTRWRRVPERAARPFQTDSSSTPAKSTCADYHVSDSPPHAERGVEKQVSLEGVSSAEEVERKIASLL